MKDVNASLREVAVLQEATEMILSSMDADTVLHHILLIVRNYFAVDQCGVFLMDHTSQELFCRAQNGYEDPKILTRRFRLGRDGVVGAVAAAKVPMYIPDVSQEPLFVPGSSQTKSELALPLVVREQVIGVLDVCSHKLDHFTDDMIGLLALFAAQSAVALENARLYATERRRMRQIEFINLIAKSTAGANDMEQLLLTLSELVSDTFDGVEVSVLVREADGSMTVQAHTGSGPPEHAPFDVSEKNGIIAQAMASKRALMVNDLASKKDWPSCIPGSSAELCVPLLCLGEILGAIVISQSKSTSFTVEDSTIAQAAGDVCATAIKNMQLSDELRRVANTDSLTGVHNQRFFHAAVVQEITRAKRTGKSFMLLILDLRSFRNVNQHVGFDAGDALLRKAGDLLTSTLRMGDTVCRYHADRFVLLLPNMVTSGKPKEDIDSLKKKIADGLAQIPVPAGAGGVLHATFAHVSYPTDGDSEYGLLRLLLQKLNDEKERTATL